MTSAQMGPVGLAVPSYTWGRGFTDVAAKLTPPAGSTVVHVVPSTYAESLLTACATLTASIAVANRFPFLTLANGDAKVYATFPVTTAVVAAGVVTVTWSVGLNIPGGGGGAAPVVPLPDLILMPGTMITIGALGLDVADQLSGVYMTLGHFPTGPTGAPTRTAPLNETAGLYAGSA